MSSEYQSNNKTQFMGIRSQTGLELMPQWGIDGEMKSYILLGLGYGEGGWGCLMEYVEGHRVNADQLY